MRKTTRTCFEFMVALALVTLPLQSSFAAPKAVQDDKSNKQISPHRSVTKTTTIETLYQQWNQQYLQAGGDRNVIVSLGPARGLTPASQAKGFLLLNLITGDVTAYVKGLTEASELYLVDNQPGPGKSVLPEQGDSIVPVGRLEPRGNAVAMLTTNLGSGFFEKFELDLAVVSQADASPMKGLMLIGTRSTFERRHTRKRLGRGEVLSISPADPSLSPQSFANDPRVQLGLVSEEVLKGGDLFFRATFNGNGRTCGSCHPVDNNQAIDPKFIKALHARNPDDPLFVAEKFHPNSVLNLEKPQLLRNHGLILENVDGFEDPVNKFTMRGVPHTLSLSTSLNPPAPNENGDLPDGSTLQSLERTGWSGDGAPAPGTLRLFPMGAVIQHFTKRLDRTPGVDFLLPTDEQLDDMVTFMLTTGRTNELNLASVTLTDPGAGRGIVLFLGDAKCSNCHNNAGANVSFLPGNVNFNFNTGVETARIKLLDNQRIPLDGGFGGQNLAAFTFDANGDGILDSHGNGTFNTPPLVEAADTGPFFHTNAFETIEEAVGFYAGDAFNNSPGGAAVGGISLTSQQTKDVAAFLRVINAAFNLSMAIQRIEAARDIEESEFGLAESELTNTLLHLANEELEDARDVLKKKNLNHSAQGDIKDAINSNTQAISSTDAVTRLQAISTALDLADQAKTSLGTGLDFHMGEGNLAF